MPWPGAVESFRAEFSAAGEVETSAAGSLVVRSDDPNAPRRIKGVLDRAAPKTKRYCSFGECRQFIWFVGRVPVTVSRLDDGGFWIANHYVNCAGVPGSKPVPVAQPAPAPASRPQQSSLFDHVGAATPAGKDYEWD